VSFEDDLIKKSSQHASIHNDGEEALSHKVSFKMGARWGYEQANKKSGWKTMDSAPVGEPTESVGSKGPSEWFLAISKAKQIVCVQRIAEPGGLSYEFTDSSFSYYAHDFFTHWKPLPEPPQDCEETHRR